MPKPEKKAALVRRTTIEQLRDQVGHLTKSANPDHYDVAEKAVLACAAFIAQEAAAIGRVLAGQAEPVSTCACAFSEIDEANRLMQHYASRAVAIEDYQHRAGVMGAPTANTDAQIAAMNMISVEDVRRYREAASKRHVDGELEVDDLAAISHGDDEGAYVQAWIWVTDDEAGIESTDETET
jgi:hypothetical protein